MYLRNGQEVTEILSLGAVGKLIPGSAAVAALPNPNAAAPVAAAADLFKNSLREKDMLNSGRRPAGT